MSIHFARIDSGLQKYHNPIAAAIIGEAKLFITNDKQLKQVNDIDVLVLKDHTPSVNGK